MKWKCVLCAAKVDGEKRPPLGQRMCGKCRVTHARRVVDIYRNGDPDLLERAKRDLAQAIADLEVKA